MWILLISGDSVEDNIGGQGLLPMVLQKEITSYDFLVSSNSFFDPPLLWA